MFSSFFQKLRMDPLGTLIILDEITYLRERLHELEKKVTVEKIAFGLGREQIRKRVGELDSDSKWKAFVTKKYGVLVLDNILNILEDKEFETLP